MTDVKVDQVQTAELLQDLVLSRFKELLEAKDETQTDRSTLVKLLMANGWTLDPADVAEKLGDFVTKKVDPKSFDDEDSL
jgi:hypothetical protein